jgi:hypothetical protein
LALALAGLFVAAVYISARRTGRDPRVALRQGAVAAACTTAWIAATGLLASRGVLRMWDPPTMGLVLGPTLLVAIGVAVSPLGRQFIAGIPIQWLVGFQGFRVLVELLLHRAYVEGLMPVQMSWSGRNFDVVSGITAVAVGLWLATAVRASSLLVALWNTLGVALLANILLVALLSAPTPFRVFTNDPPNVFITRAPWVWLPAVMVFAAILGHALVIRWLLGQMRSQGDSTPLPPRQRTTGHATTTLLPALRSRFRHLRAPGPSGPHVARPGAFQP